MAKVLYTAEATVTGGRIEGHGKTTDGALEEGYASCFESALSVSARRAEAV